MIVWRRDLHDVHPDEIYRADDLPDPAQHFTGEHPAGLRGSGTGSHARIDDVDIQAQVDVVGAIQGLIDGLGDDRLRAALLDLAHEVVAHALFLHPLEGLDRWPVAAQTYLHEVLALDRTRLDEPPHRRAVAGQDAPVVGGGIGVRVKMDDPDAARAAHLGDGRGAGPGDGVIPAQDDRDGAGLGDLQDLAVDQGMRAVDPCGHDVRVAGIDDLQDLERFHAELERIDGARCVLGFADRARAETGTRSMAHGIVEWRADDRDVHLETAQFIRVRDPRQLHEADGAYVGRQVVVGVRLVGAIPAVGGRVIRGGGRRLGSSVVGALGHGNLRETVHTGGRPVVDRPDRLAWGAAGS